MKYTVNDLSTVKKSVRVSVPANEVDAKINFMIKDLGRDLKIAGFRPGKAPRNLVEKRYKAQIYKEATAALINENAAESIKEMEITPISAINYDGPEAIERGKDFEFTFDFEIIPEFEMPTWEGIALDEELEIYDEAKTDEVIERIRIQMSEILPLEVSRPGKDGEIAFVDFSANDEDGNEVKNFRETGYQLVLGQGQLQDDFELIIRNLSPGETGEGPVKVADQIDEPNLAGKSLTVKATVVSLAERILPELTDEFAEKIGAGTIEKMRESIAKAHKENLKRTAKENSQGKLLEGLLEHLDYELPPSLVERRKDSLKAEFTASMKRMGKQDPKDWPLPEAELETKFLNDAKVFVKGEMFLLKLAEKEKVNVTQQEMESYLFDIANRSGLDPQQLKEYYYQNNLMHTLEERIKVEKALGLVYERAEINEIAAKPKDTEKGNSEDEQKTQANEQQDTAEKTE